MTEKNIFFVNLNVDKYFRFQLIFYVKTAPRPWKKSPPLSQQLPVKIEIPSSPSPLFENLVRGSTPLCPLAPFRKGVQTMFRIFYFVPHHKLLTCPCNHCHVLGNVIIAVQAAPFFKISRPEVFCKKGVLTGL